MSKLVLKDSVLQLARCVYIVGIYPLTQNGASRRRSVADIAQRKVKVGVERVYRIISHIYVRHWRYINLRRVGSEEKRSLPPLFIAMPVWASKDSVILLALYLCTFRIYQLTERRDRRHRSVAGISHGKFHVEVKGFVQKHIDSFLMSIGTLSKENCTSLTRIWNGIWSRSSTTQWTTISSSKKM